MPTSAATAAAVLTRSATEIYDVQIGFDGLYKLGCWTPIRIKLRGGPTPETGHVALMVADTDGVPTTVVSPPVHLKPGQNRNVSMLVRPGQSQGSLQVRWIVANQSIAQRTYFMETADQIPARLTAAKATDRIPAVLPATNRLILILGPSPGIAELVQNSQAEHPEAATRVVQIQDTAQLPTRPCGYEGIDTMVLTTSNPAIDDPLRSNPQQLQALIQWLEQGGRLLLFCGRSAPKLLAPGRPFASLIPGHYERQLPLRNVLPLETYSEAEKPMPRGRFNLRVPKLADVSGQILAYVGRQPIDLPLIVRAPYRLGEILFVGIDVDLPPFRDWSGRSSLLRKLLSWPPQEVASQQQRGQRRAPVDDLAAQLRAALDQHFTGVVTLPFALVAILVVSYIGLIGPGDFFFLQKLLRRMEWTWVTFPLIVVGTSVGAYWLATTYKGDQLRVAQVEIVDVDLASRKNSDRTVAKPNGEGLVRGTVWTHFFSPSAMRYDLTLLPNMPGSEATQAGRADSVMPTAADDRAKTLVAWLGLPGHALGGMQADGAQTSLMQQGYRFGQSLQSLQDLPVQVWSTKTIQAEWTASENPPVEIELRQSSDRLLVGRITNHLGVEMTDCLLLYDRWAYPLARLGDGGTVTIDDELQPRTLKTMLTSATAGDIVATRIAEDGTVPFRRFSADVTRIVKAMMFYEAIGGAGYTGALNRYQHRMDMSHLLQMDRAILLARIPGTGSRWFHADKPLQGNQDQHWLFYRFVAPVRK